MKKFSNDNRAVPREQTDRHAGGRTDGQRDKSKPILTLRNYVNASKILRNL